MIQIITEFMSWSTDKASRFSKSEVAAFIEQLCDTHVMERNMLGFSVNRPRP